MCPSATWGLSHRPLTASAADEVLLVARVTEATTIRQVADLTLNTFLTGPRGSRKTSLLCHVERPPEQPSPSWAGRWRGGLGVSRLLEAGIPRLRPSSSRHHRVLERPLCYTPAHLSGTLSGDPGRQHAAAAIRPAGT